MASIKYDKKYYVETNYDIGERVEANIEYGCYSTEKDAIGALNNARTFYPRYIWSIRLEPIYQNNEELQIDR